MVYGLQRRRSLKKERGIWANAFSGEMLIETEPVVVVAVVNASVAFFSTNPCAVG